MKYKLSFQSGFTLLELMVTLFLSTALMLGISTAYGSISGLVHTSKNLENAQEVLRYSAEVFTRSLKQTVEDVDVSSNQLTVTQSAGAIACDGSVVNVVFDEIYTLESDQLKCQINAATPVTILIGVETMTFSEVERIVTITVKPEALTGETTEAVDIDIALSGIILINALGA